MTLQRWITGRRVLTPPAIWGKLPGHADFVQHRVQRGEGAAWRAWLEREGAFQEAGRAARIPIAFVLPPAALPLGTRAYVMGAVRASHDRIGRPCPVLVYQFAHPRWVHAYLGALSRAQRSQMDWLFLLTRLLAGADSAQTVPGRVEALSSAIDTQWQAHAPDMRCALVAAHAQSHALRMAEAANGEQRPALPDPAADLQGVRFLPWSDWPRSLLKPPYRAAFWQQDANGGFIDAAEQLGPLWIERP